MELCPCGSQKAYVDCCQPLIKGERTADTAEALMRSRYTAHAKKEFDYLFKTTHPSNRQDDDRKGTCGLVPKAGLAAAGSSQYGKGGPDDSAGTVEFLARYRKDSKAFDHHEIAEFVREDGRWYFKDGQAPQPVQAIRQGPKIGRNDPCSCGSGKKYKKCCGK
jgi:SEC-C motif-containing protein